MTQELASYYRELERQLQCPRAKRKEFLQETQRMTADFIESSPHAEFSDVVSFVGSPEELAQTYHETLGQEVTEKFRRARRLKRILLLGVVVAGLITAILYNVYLQNRQYDVEITAVQTIVIYETEEGED